MDLVQILLKEHQDYVFKLEELAEVIAGIRLNGRGSYFIETLDGLLDPLTVDLNNHAAREERWLFPLLLERVPDSPVPLMVEEHRTIRDRSAVFEHWYTLWRDGKDDVLAQWVEPALDLRGIFSTHMQKENLILFPLAKRVLTPEELALWTAP